MEPKLLIMGTDKHYYHITTDRDFLQQRAVEIYKTCNDGRELECLVDTSIKIDPKQLYSFGVSKEINGSNQKKETIVECLENLFENVKNYAKYYNAPFALIHDLQTMDKSRCKQASVMVQLYL
ncbi:MAG: hypothetical protein KKF46_02165 [Nanoarchaeota archaeon]|nr:hypothetical protein [Nanoarchaeota archaeon]MBU1321139.1 hypothetical protein [Nanoarchaeota archaeon]MBU1597893.1 hypothetical protein [Nanoarchaeota archaeon]MBU2441608.1 hypothetical protein [Nanoarchaeota archaeon]